MNYPYDDYSCYPIDLPGDIRGAITETTDGWPVIFVNDYLDPPARRKAFRHEMKHHTRNDLYSAATIREVESCQGPRNSI